MTEAVVFDLDDTLLHNDRTISDTTVRVLRTLALNGIRIIPASGRSPESMNPMFIGSAAVIHLSHAMALKCGTLVANAS